MTEVASNEPPKELTEEEKIEQAFQLRKQQEIAAEKERTAKVIPFKELRDTLQFNPDTGYFTWIETKGKVKKGDIAGYIRKDGTRCIRLNNKMYSAHYLAAYSALATYPATGSISFINGNKDDCSLKNLMWDHWNYMQHKQCQTRLDWGPRPVTDNPRETIPEFEARMKALAASKIANKVKTGGITPEKEALEIATEILIKETPEEKALRKEAKAAKKAKKKLKEAKKIAKAIEAHRLEEERLANLNL